MNLIGLMLSGLICIILWILFVYIVFIEPGYLMVIGGVVLGIVCVAWPSKK
jgi:hypothetical protein